MTQCEAVMPADPDGKAEPSKMRLESLVGKLLGATLSTLSASISRASLMRKMGPTVRNKEYGVDTEMSVILEESDSEEGPSEPASGVATPPTEPGDAEGTKEDEVPVPDKPRRMFEWNLFGREKKKWEKKVKRYQDEFKKMRRKAPTTQVLSMPRMASCGHDSLMCSNASPFCVSRHGLPPRAVCRWSS